MRVCYAACGLVATNVFITDLGNGKCEYLFVKGDATPQVGGDCTNPINLFDGLICQTYLGAIFMLIQNADSLPAATYVPPDFDIWLTNVGLGSIVTAGAPC
jgi:hypothetical protein